jgi:hypothetical protein
LSRVEHLTRNDQGNISRTAQTHSFVLNLPACCCARQQRFAGVRVVVRFFPGRRRPRSRRWNFLSHPTANTTSPRTPASGPVSLGVPYLNLSAIPTPLLDKQFTITGRTRQSTAQHDDLRLLPVSAPLFATAAKLHESNSYFYSARCT